MPKEEAGPETQTRVLSLQDACLETFKTGFGEHFRERGFLPQFRQLACMLGMVKPSYVDGDILHFEARGFKPADFDSPTINPDGILLINRNRMDMEVAAVYGHRLETSNEGDLTIAPMDGYEITDVSLLVESPRPGREVIVGLAVEFSAIEDPAKKRSLKILLASENPFMPIALQIHSGLVFQSGENTDEYFQFAQLLSRPRRLTAVVGSIPPQDESSPPSTRLLTFQ